MIKHKNLTILSLLWTTDTNDPRHRRPASSWGLRRSFRRQCRQVGLHHSPHRSGHHPAHLHLSVLNQHALDRADVGHLWKNDPDRVFQDIPEQNATDRDEEARSHFSQWSSKEREGESRARGGANQAESETPGAWVDTKRQEDNAALYLFFKLLLGNSTGKQFTPNLKCRINLPAGLLFLVRLVGNLTCAVQTSFSSVRLIWLEETGGAPIASSACRTLTAQRKTTAAIFVFPRLQCLLFLWFYVLFYFEVSGLLCVSSCFTLPVRSTMIVCPALISFTWASLTFHTFHVMLPSEPSSQRSQCLCLSVFWTLLLFWIDKLVLTCLPPHPVSPLFFLFKGYHWIVKALSRVFIWTGLCFWFLDSDDDPDQQRNPEIYFIIPVRKVVLLQQHSKNLKLIKGMLYFYKSWTPAMYLELCWSTCDSMHKIMNII